MARQTYGAENLASKLTTLCSSRVQASTGIADVDVGGAHDCRFLCQKMLWKGSCAWWRRPSLPYTEALGYDRSYNCCSLALKIAHCNCDITLHSRTMCLSNVCMCQLPTLQSVQVQKCLCLSPRSPFGGVHFEFRLT